LKHIIRTPGNFNPETGAVEFFPNEDMRGKTIQLVHLGRDEMLEGVKRAAISAKNALSGFKPEAVFMFSCHLRHRVLHSRTGEEVAMVKKVFGEKVPIIGCYCAGEYGPLYNSYEDVTRSEKPLSGSKQLSTSISIMVIGSKPEPAGKTEFNYYKKLREYERADKKIKTSVAALNRKLKENESLLKKSERIISETEKAFKNINSEHYRLTVELQKKNGELIEANEKNEKLQDIIKKYTPHNVWKKARKTVEAGRYEIPDEELFRVLMFIDIKGFTSYAEKHVPADVIKAINVIFNPLTDIVYSNGGDIDKFIGDCIFAVFTTENEAFSAALEAQKFMRNLKADHFKIRIGINGGRVISGNVGGETRRDSTLIGDAVNLAQRLESNCEPGAVLISEDAFDRIDGKLLKGFEIIKKSIEVKGKERPVKAVGVFI
ncbi:MAG TPA: adenylate/guanylate cyclase domain-containing protein, partial [Candidatus Wallbacteria bacterium]|nr:adenylate/guanylate cyclase domain-containing protein [Candidatus Wallbacteria bacterium]